MRRSVLDTLDVSLDFLTKVVDENPSLRGMILGYVAEAKLREVLEGHGRASAFRKDDDHDRKKKGDLVLTYEGFEFKIEVKSLQTNTVELFNEGDNTWLRKVIKQKGPGRLNPAYAPVWASRQLTGRYRGQFQCDASDRRRVTFPDRSTLETTNLLFGEFHVLAAALFAFREKWDFAFALNRDLPPSSNRNYSESQRQNLIASMVSVTWPPASPFVTDIYPLLDFLVAEERAKAAGRPTGEPRVEEATEIKVIREARVVTEKTVKVTKGPKKGKA